MRKLDKTKFEDLASRFRNGEEVFSQLYNSSYWALHRFISKYLYDEDDIQDIIQDTYSVLDKYRYKFRGDCKFWNMTLIIAKRKALGRLRKKINQSRRIRWISLYQRIGEDQLLANILSHSPGEQIEVNDFKERVLRALDHLSSHHREILDLKINQDLDYPCIAKKLNLSLGTVKSRISRARNHLRELLKQM